MSLEYVIASTVFWVGSLIILFAIYLEVVQMRKVVHRFIKAQEEAQAEFEAIEETEEDDTVQPPPPVQVRVPVQPVAAAEPKVAATVPGASAATPSEK
jgi:hypothetical protein